MLLSFFFFSFFGSEIEEIFNVETVELFSFIFYEEDLESLAIIEEVVE